MSEVEIKDSVRTLAGGKKVKVKAHARRTKGKGNTPVRQHRRGKKMGIAHEPAHKGKAGDEFLKRKAEINEKGETVTHDKETGGITWTMPVNKAAQSEAEKAERQAKIKFFTESHAKSQKLLTQHTRELAAAKKSGDKDLVAKATERLEGSQDMVDRTARLLAQHKGVAAPKPQFPKKETSAADAPYKAPTGTVAQNGGLTKGLKPKKGAPIPAEFKGNEQPKITSRSPENGPGAAPKSSKEVEESEFSQKVKAWQARHPNAGNIPHTKKAIRAGKVQRVFGASKKKGQPSLKDALAAITKKYNG